MEDMHKDHVVEEMYLVGLESLIYFLLSEDKLHAPVSSQLWQQVLKSPKESKSLCLAIAYFHENEKIKKSLQDLECSLRHQTCIDIAIGLLLMELQLKDANTFSKIKQLRHQVLSYHDLYHPFDALEEAIINPMDEKNLKSLLRLFQSDGTMQKKLSRHLQEKKFWNTEACSKLLNNPSFYTDLCNRVISWSLDQVKRTISIIQCVISGTLFKGYPKKEHLLNSITSWMLGRTDRALSGHIWNDLTNIHHIGESLSRFISDKAHIIFRADTSGVLYPDIMPDFLDTIELITTSPLDTESIAKIMLNTATNQWFKKLLVYSFSSVYSEHFRVNFTDIEMLWCIDTKLLQILYNVFITDQYQSETKIGLISEDEVRRILDWLPHIKPSSDAYSALCCTILSMWEKKLSEIHFKEFLDHWHCLTEADKMRTTFLANRVRLCSEDNHSEFMSMLFMIKEKYIKSNSQESCHLIALFEGLYYKKFTLKKAREIIKESEYRDWSEQFRNIEKQESRSRAMKEVMHLIDIQIKSHKYQKSDKELLLIKKEAEQIELLMKKEAEQIEGTSPTPVFQLKKLQQCFTLDQKLQWFANNRVEFVAHLLKIWTSVTKRSPYNTQIVSLLLFLHTDHKGLLQQVKTGEGKTMIVALLAAAKALLGYRVDIVTSNRDLAEDGARKCQKFFRKLDLKAAVNCTDDYDTNQQAYRSHIVYGDVESYQRDVLAEERNLGSTRFSARYSDMKKNCLLVDEVDNMFLDKGSHMLYISHQSPALKHLESLLILIWESVLSIKPEEAPIETALDNLVKCLNIAIKKRNMIHIPDYLTSFCHNKMKAWVHSAYQARCMDVNDHFVIDHHKREESVKQPKQILPMDKQTGIEQYNMKWSNGLSQFLELKYRRALSSESLKAIFISNKRFFQRYDEKLYGLTGTLGSASSRKMLEEVYNVCTVEIPTNKARRYVQKKVRIATGDEHWCKEINEEIAAHCDTQPILVICENIKKLQYVRGYIDSHSAGNLKIISYSRDGEDVEKRFDEGSASHNQVILATNKGGRGTDIKG